MQQKLSLVFFLILFSASTISFSQQMEITIDSSFKTNKNFFPANNKLIQYTGRIDFRNEMAPRMWSPAVYITLKFKGDNITAVINDEELWNKNHNYLEIILDNDKKRIQTKYKTNYINIKNLKNVEHVLRICKNTESNIGFIEYAGVYCDALLKPTAKPKRKIEFIGNSIACGTGSDESEIPCGKGVWQDQHNAYLAYGPITAKALNAQWQVSAVSGIGLIHSCCNMNVVMPPVFNKIDLRGDSIVWDFANYQPDVITVSLGQNDGVQDSTAFTTAYIDFVKTLRKNYNKATIVLLTSPMADNKLRAFLKSQIAAVINYMSANGENNMGSFVFEKSYTSGCDAHPNIKEHQEIANKLTTYLKKKMGW